MLVVSSIIGSQKFSCRHCSSTGATEENSRTQVDTNTAVSNTSEHTPYAHLSKTQFLVTFDAKGGAPEAASKLVSYGNKYGILPKAQIAGYEFGGRYLDENCTNQLTIADVVVLQQYLLGMRTFNKNDYINATDRGYIGLFGIVVGGI